MYSAASAKRSATGGTGRGPTDAPSDSPSDTITDQPARPPLTWSRVAICVDTRSGSVVTVGISGISPTASVTGATRQAISVGSSHGTDGPASGTRGPSASVTSSRPARSASLPNHRPLHVAEQFLMLSSLYPGRIDLGIGRSEGTLDDAIVLALGRPSDTGHGAGYEDQLDQLLAFADLAPLPDGHPLAGVRAGPQEVPFPPVFMLGSSLDSARAAARRGLRHHQHVRDRGSARVLRAARGAGGPDGLAADAIAGLSRPGSLWRPGVNRRRGSGRGSRTASRPPPPAPVPDPRRRRTAARRRRAAPARCRA